MRFRRRGIKKMNRKALHLISYGLYVVTSTNGEAINVMVMGSAVSCPSPQELAGVLEGVEGEIGDER